MNNLDTFITSRTAELRENITTAMNEYDLQKAVRYFYSFLDDLNNFYIRNSRDRIRQSKETQDILRQTLKDVSILLAPFCPFISDYIYQKTGGNLQSVHLEQWLPQKDINKDINEEVLTARTIISLALSIRAREKIRVRQPLSKLYIAGRKISSNWESIVKEEVNIKEIVHLKETISLAEKQILPNAKILGPRLGGLVQKIILEAKSGNYEIRQDGSVIVLDQVLSPEEFEIRYIPKSEEMLVSALDNIVVALDGNISEDLYLEGIARDMIRIIQDSRKEHGLKMGDPVSIKLEVSSEDQKKSTSQFEDLIKKECSLLDIYNGDIIVKV